MKVFLAGLEDRQWVHVAATAGHPYALFSYFHWKKTPDTNKEWVRDALNRHMREVICDSGLFTLMFGAGKGGSYDLSFMKDYTRTYIKTAQGMGIRNLTIVESDVHKLLGMRAVFELRKQFEDCGLPVLYVWHKEEGIDGLMRMVERYPYIALSIPELRIIFKGSGKRYQTITHQLLHQIRRHVGDRMPKIHLLGNTVTETMETTLAYSCDSTSWLAGGRFGTCMSFQLGRLKQIRRTSDFFKSWREEIYCRYPDIVAEMNREYGHRPSSLGYQISNLFSAMSYRHYQDHLDKKFPWIGLKRGVSS